MFHLPNYGKRIRECADNLLIDSQQPDTLLRKRSFYGQVSEGVQIRKGASFADDNDGWLLEDDITDWDAFFFENTDYPLHANINSHGIRLLRLTIGKEQNQHVAAEDSIIFGTVNFKNQVGRTDIRLVYEKNGREESLAFTTEVLSYKMDYRTDMRNVIRDIEEEFAMLSYSFLKQTYLTFRTSNHESPDLIWWQIFRDCFEKITDAARQIINNPKRRLQTTVRYERAERMPYMPADLENEYEEFKDNPSHLYRMEEMFLSKDTVENRFLKYALRNIYDRFKRVHQNVRKILKADNIDLLNQISTMNDSLYALNNDPFFRGIGTFKGFTQDSLVMKQAAGYRDVYEYWIILQCGYDLQEGVMQLEVKDISELYEIWCFIKVKNIVQHILRGKAAMKSKGSKTEGDFVKTLLQGSKSEITFFDNSRPELQMVSLMYNATTDDEEHVHDESPASQNTDIADTTSKTTEQRPDIVLRLCKTEGGIQYTYLFDAKYRLRDTTIPPSDGVEVPPVDAINQMHRYRDAIYYSREHEPYRNKEIIGGYILFPGRGDDESILKRYYSQSIREVNIGAFPLLPNNDSLLRRHLEDILINYTSDETHVSKSRPQRSLAYITEEEKLSIPTDDLVMVALAADEMKRQWSFENKWYNIPLDKIANSPWMQAKYILLLVGNETVAGNLHKIVKSRHDVWTKETLIENNYPATPSHSAYFMLGIQALDNRDAALKNLKFNVKDNYHYFWRSRQQLFNLVKLKDLMEVRVDF